MDDGSPNKKTGKLERDIKAEQPTRVSPRRNKKSKNDVNQKSILNFITIEGEKEKSIIEEKK